MSAQAVAARPPSSSAWLAAIAAARAWLFLIVLLVGFELWSEFSFGATFVFNTYNVRSILVFATAPLMLAIGQTFVIISGGIDLSVGFTMGFAAVIAAHTVNVLTPQIGTLPALAVALVCSIGGSFIPGIVNGWLIARLRVPPFIGTLGMYGVARGVAFLIAGGTTVPISNTALNFMGNGTLFGIPMVVLLTALTLLVLHYVLSETRFGQYTYALGGSRAAAVRAGINVRRLTVWLYILSAVCAGIGGVLYTGRFSAGAAQAGEPLLLDSIAGVVIGGASLFGGSGTVLGTLIGALIIAVIQYGLVFVNVEPFWQFVAVGVVIIISVLVDQAQRKGGRVDE